MSKKFSGFKICCNKCHREFGYYESESWSGEQYFYSDEQAKDIEGDQWKWIDEDTQYCPSCLLEEEDEDEA